jgi:diguanylate cyclase (GGDEF)-like protein/PAS domain S-box-containing protein
MKHDDKNSSPEFPLSGLDDRGDYDLLIRYVRDKIDQLLTVMGTLPLRPEELDDKTLLSIDPIGVIAESFQQILDHHRKTNQRLELANNEIEAILNTVGLPILVLDKQLNIELSNQMAVDLLFDEIHVSVMGHKFDSMYSGWSETSLQGIIQRVLANGQADRVNDLVLDQHIFDLFVTPLKDKQGVTEKIILAFVDTTERKQTEAQLRLAAAVFENNKDAIVVTDQDNRIITVNNALLEMMGYKTEELIGKNPSIFASGKHNEPFYKVMWGSLNNRGYWKGEIWERRKSGSLFPAWQSISAVKGEDGSVTNYISIISDITAQKQSQEQLDFLAHHDPLTGLPNRILFSERLSHAIEKAKRQDMKLAIVFIDLDRFKNINDTLGHATGDKLLVEVARHMENHIRKVDTVARLGGDEFIILLDDVKDESDVAHFARHLINSFHDAFVIDGYDLFLTLSIGICICPEDGDDVGTLVKNADTAMYRAKEEGRNGFRFFTEELSRKVFEKLTLENYLRQAISLKQFELYFQPQYTLHDRRLLSAEALLRWDHPRLGMVAPDRFIPLAEETGLILELGDWVIDEACRQLRYWRDRNHRIDFIAINVSGLQIQRGKLVRTLLDAVDRYSLQPSDVEIEITESIIVEDSEAAVRVLKECKQHGFGVAIDDFGTGYSSLGYLKKLPVDKLKIDRSFVKDIEIDPEDDAIVRAIIALAKNLQLTVVAEGIESESQFCILSDLGCEIAQGYFLGRPVSRMSFEKLFD